MPQKFSTYLDVVRFAAALFVFLGHAAGMNWTGGFLWQIGAYADTCVVVFFVLSGFVIAYVTDAKEHSWQIYAASRMSRIWSIAIPALLLTFLIDSIGVRVAPELYLGQSWYAGDRPVLRYVTSFFMLHEVWHLKLVPGINAPFWSLSFEVFYYLAFGVIFYFKNKFRFLIVVFLMAIAGPLIAALFPIWLLGYIAYKQTRQMHTSKAASLGYFFAGLSLLLLSPYIRSIDSSGLQVLGESVVGRYVDAVGFYLNLIGAYGLSRFGKPVGKGTYLAISSMASTTFALYLFHRPLIQFFSYIGPDDPASFLRRLLVIGGTLIIVFALSPLCEKLRIVLRHLILRFFQIKNSKSDLSKQLSTQLK
jgi:peptidoglycan/LPS O-acetylase OafA/YrhL